MGDDSAADLSMQRLTTLIQQERSALDSYESLVHTMRTVLYRDQDSVRRLGETFETALGRLQDATTRIVNTHTALAGAVSDAQATGVTTGQESALRELDDRRGALLRQATELMELLAGRRDVLQGELDKVRVPRKPRSVYGGGEGASIIDVSG
jgi:predicted  nucleic acid-binding Zn-ribbon protein